MSKLQVPPNAKANQFKTIAHAVPVPVVLFTSIDSGQERKRPKSSLLKASEKKPA
jgi:hypothetical protein